MIFFQTLCRNFGPYIKTSRYYLLNNLINAGVKKKILIEMMHK